MKKILHRLKKDELNAGYLALMLALVCGRVLGLLREIVLVNLYGSDRVTDLMILGLTLPDVMANLLATSGLVAGLTPVLARTERQKRLAIVWAAIIVIAAVFLVIAGVIWLFSSFFFNSLAFGLGGLSPEELNALNIAIVVVPLAGISGVLVASLMARGKFIYGGLGTALFNIVIILGLLLGLLVENVLYLFCGFLILGAVFRLILHVWASDLSPAELFILRPNFSSLPFKAVCFSAAGMASLTSVPLALRSLATSLGEGALTQLTLAIKLIEIPLTVVFWSIGISALPKLARLYQEEPSLANAQASNRLLLSAKLGILCSVVVVLAAPALLSVGFSNGQMSTASLARVSEALIAGALYLPFMAVTTVLINDAFARSGYGAVAFAVFGSALSVLPALAVRDLTDLMSAWGGIYAATGLILLVARAFSVKSQLPALKTFFMVTGYWLLGASNLVFDFGVQDLFLFGSAIAVVTCITLWGSYTYATAKNALT